MTFLAQFELDQFFMDDEGRVSIHSLTDISHLPEDSIQLISKYGSRDHWQVIYSLPASQVEGVIAQCKVYEERDKREQEKKLIQLKKREAREKEIAKKRRLAKEERDRKEYEKLKKIFEKE